MGINCYNRSFSGISIRGPASGNKYVSVSNRSLKLFEATDFIALLTQHLPPKRVQRIRCYGLYSSRSRGKWIEKPYVVRLAPDVWRRKHLDYPDSPKTQEECTPDCSVCSSESRAAWARLIAKVYEVNPLECVKCGDYTSYCTSLICSLTFEIKCLFLLPLSFFLKFCDYIFPVELIEAYEF
ncbi:MAG TPA: hypothetical protein ENI06_04515 [Spirochaetales bacterium]|nr:hypothetical protein [Spirochaetales bacterium]